MNSSHPARPVAVPVCDRCKHRRQKCDKIMEGCNACVIAGETCCFTDPETNQTLPRLYLKQLEDRLLELQARKDKDSPPAIHPTTPLSASSPASDFPTGRLSKRYLGDSSGLIFIRGCIDMAKSNDILAPSTNTGRVRQEGSRMLGELPQLLPPDDGIPLTQTTMEGLFGVFQGCQNQYSILTYEEFQEYLGRFLEEQLGPDPLSTACVHMVFAVAMGHLGKTERNTTASKLAEIYYQRVLGELHHILYPRTLRSLQVILLVLLFSLSNPQQPVVWHLVGYALRLSTELGLHNLDSEENAGVSNIDRGRRLFWSLYSIDRAVGNTLGRPTGLRDLDISAPFPDSASNGTANACITNHCFQLRQLQSEVADVMYQCINPYPDSFIEHTQSRIDHWIETVPDDVCSADMIDWFNHAYHNLSIFLHRPSVANPHPLPADIRKCFDSSQAVLRLYWKLYKADAVDCTWMAIHWLFLAGIVHLYCLWTDVDIRNSVDWSIVLEDTQTTSMVITAMAERWTSAEGVPQVYHDLCIGTFRKYGELYPQHESDMESPS